MTRTEELIQALIQHSSSLELVTKCQANEIKEMAKNNMAIRELIQATLREVDTRANIATSSTNTLKLVVASLIVVVITFCISLIVPMFLNPEISINDIGGCAILKE